MNRLTEKDDQGNWSLRGVRWEQLHEGQTITRELWKKLYGALWKLMEYEDTGSSPDEVIRLNDFDRCESGRLLKKLCQEREKHRWITPEERLPEIDDLVLVQIDGACKNITFVDAIELGSYDQEEGWGIEAWPKFEGDIIAWQPLPEIYKEEP